MHVYIYTFGLLSLISNFGLAFHENGDIRFKQVCGKELESLVIHLCGAGNFWDGEEGNSYI